MSKNRMGSEYPARLAAWSGITGGTLWFASGIAGIVFPQLNVPGTTAFAVGGALATVTLVLLLVGFLGIAWGGALGGPVGKGVFAVAAAGYALMVVGAAQTVAGVGPLVDPEAGIALLYLLGRLISAVFTLFTGVAVLVAKRWHGWAAFAPILLGLCPLVGELGFVVMFGQPSQVFNAAWGVFAALVGLAVFTQAKPRKQLDEGTVTEAA